MADSLIEKLKVFEENSNQQFIQDKKGNLFTFEEAAKKKVTDIKGYVSSEDLKNEVLKELVGDKLGIPEYRKLLLFFLAARERTTNNKYKLEKDLGVKISLKSIA